MKLTILETPYSGNIQLNLNFARACLLHSIHLGETPFASHLFYTQVLDDTIPQDRTLGMTLGFNFYHHAQLCAVYTNLGISNGMLSGIRHAESLRIPVVYRRLPIFNHHDK